jgi:hypothetical protein
MSNPVSYDRTQVEKKAIFDRLDEQYKQLANAQASDAARQAQIQTENLVRQRAMAAMSVDQVNQQFFAAAQSKVMSNLVNVVSPSLGFLTSGDVGYFEQPPEYTFFSPIGSLKEEPVPEKPKPTKVDSKIHRRKLNLDD